MDQLVGLRAFREVVDTGSFTAAADRLSMSVPMVSKHVSRLEQRLGARLLHRSSRHLSLTEAGSAYYEQSRQALDLLDAAAAAVGQGSATARGRLKVSAPGWCASGHFAAALARYRLACPDVLVSMHLENRVVDLIAEGYDVALRALADGLDSPTLIARPLCPVRFELVAAPQWLAQRPIAVEPGRPVRVDAVLPTYVDLDGLVLRADAGSLPSELRLQPRAVLRTDDSNLLRHAACAGIAAALLPTWLIEDDLQQRRLVPVLPGHARAITLFAVYASREFMPTKLRTFIDFMGSALPQPLP